MVTPVSTFAHAFAGPTVCLVSRAVTSARTIDATDCIQGGPIQLEKFGRAKPPMRLVRNLNRIIENAFRALAK